MENFVFHNPVRILFGKEQIANIAGQIPACTKILITYGGGSIKANGVFEQVKFALAGHSAIEFSGMVKRDNKREKLLQYAERVWGIDSGSEQEQIKAAIAKTRNFFESVGIATHLSAYGVSADTISVFPCSLLAWKVVVLLP